VKEVASSAVTNMYTNIHGISFLELCVHSKNVSHYSTVHKTIMDFTGIKVLIMPIPGKFFFILINFQ
jgi:hypothetical protein